MRTVKINRDKLLEIMEANREQHILDFNEAMIAYREAAIEEMKRNLKQAQKGGEIEHHIEADKPKSYENTYNSIINMLTLTEEETIELTAQEFSQYVEDEWGWKAHFNNTMGSYGISGASGPRGPQGPAGDPGPRGAMAAKMGLK